MQTKEIDFSREIISENLLLNTLFYYKILIINILCAKNIKITSLSNLIY